MIYLWSIMKAIDLFAGIGGTSLAMNYAGIEVVGHVEIKPYCQQILLKHWPEVPIYSDVFKFKGNECGKYELLHASFPCQPFSIAGSKRGKEDERYLWAEVLRIIKYSKPLWFTGENVKGLINVALEDILISLEELHYEARAYVWSSAAVGAPHERNRVFIVAHADGYRWDTVPQAIRRKSREHGMGKEDNQFIIETNTMRKSITRADYQDRICRTNDGLSSRLDKVRWPGLKGELDEKKLVTYKKYDSERLTALGNAVNPWQMVPLFTCIRETQQLIERGETIE